MMMWYERDEGRKWRRRRVASIAPLRYAEPVLCIVLRRDDRLEIDQGIQIKI